MTDFMNLFKELDDTTLEKVSRENVIRAPFSYAGGKTKSIKYILQYLPYRQSYIEPFGGSGAILLSRQPSDLEVFNDRYAGVVAFYRCLRDKSQQLISRLTDIVHSREEFIWCKDTWETCTDDVERAARWYYMLMTSFSSLGRNFGRSTKGLPQIPNKLAKHVLDFDIIHNRIQNCLIENQDYKNILHDFDNPEAVFYLDPPYYMVHKGTFKHELTEDEHRTMLNHIFKMQGFVAISGYHNELYDSYTWSDVHEWKANISLRAMAFQDENNKIGESATRETVTEVLYIKE